MNTEFEFVRLVGEERRVGTTLASVSRHWQDKKECFLFASPHDDDVVIGSAIFIQHAVEQGIPVHILIVTDGSMGYCKPEHRDSIAGIRKEETYECFKVLGVPESNVHYLEFPDGGLTSYRGRRCANECDHVDLVIEDYAGLQNSFTYWLRKIRPTQCFLPTENDFHPDHKITYAEFLISVFHASGNIWPELGAPLGYVPYLHELAIYCDFPSAPNLRIKCSDRVFEKKLESILAYRSQEQIHAIIDEIRKTGPMEFFRNVEFKLYNPLKHNQLFDHPQPFKGMFR